MAVSTLPEEMLVLVLTFLPVKSLIRFTCVSKHFHSIILSDPKFAKSQFRATRDRKTLTQRLLRSERGPPFESIDLEAPSFGSVRELKLPFPPPSRGIVAVVLLGSCNGIVFLTNNDDVYYLWNPSTRFFKRLPVPGFTRNARGAILYGFGYLPATEDYRVFIVSQEFKHRKNEVGIYTSRSQAWKIGVVDALPIIFFQGSPLNEALHWLSQQNEIVAFDLAQEEDYMFRKMLLPPKIHDKGGDNCSNRLAVSAGGCLCVAHFLRASDGCIDVWVMREYDVLESWTKLYSFNLLVPLKDRWNYHHVFFMETGMVAEIFFEDFKRGPGKILQKQEEEGSIYMMEGDWMDMIQYEETLLRIDA